jgi:hypothetical protein
MLRRAKSVLGRLTSPQRLILLVILVCALSLLAGILAFDEFPSTLGDNAEFAILGKALADGEGFRYMNHPDERPATKYPPGFPAFLASWITFFGPGIISLKTSVLVCFIGAMAVSFLLMRKLVDDSLSLLAVLLAITSWSVVSYSYQILSEVPYMLFSLLAVLLVMHERRKMWVVAIGLIMCLWAYLIRTVGVSLVLATAIVLFVRARRKEAILLICGFVVVSALWAIRNYTMAGEGSRYMKVLLAANPLDPEEGMITATGVARRAWINLSSYAGYLIPLNLVPTLIGLAEGHQIGPLTYTISVLLMIVVGLGVYSLRKKGLLVHTYTALYFLVYLGWPEIWRGERFMIPIAPVVALYFIMGLKSILGYFNLKRFVLVAVTAAFILTNLYTFGLFARRTRGYSPGWYSYLETALWAGEYTPEDSIVVCRKPFMFYLFSGRRTVSYPFTRDLQAMWDYFVETGPDYIVVDNFGPGGPSTTEVYLLPALREMVPYLETVYTSEEPVNALLRFDPRGVINRE